MPQPGYAGAGASPNPPFALLSLRDLTLVDGTLRDAFSRASNKGVYGRVVFADWQPPAPPTGKRGGSATPPPLVRVALKVLVGEAPGGQGGNTSHFAFLNESAILSSVRKAVDGLKVPLPSAALSDAEGRPIAAKAGLRLLCYTFCTGTEPEGRDYLPRLQAEDAVGLADRPTPPGTPLFLIAMEPLMGGTLRARQEGATPLSKSSNALGGVLCAVADMFAALAALHHLGYAHSDIK